MKNTLITLLVLAAASTLSCHKDKLDQIEQINFGYSNYAWFPICETYQLSPTELYEPASLPCDYRDTLPIVYGVQLSAEKFALAKRLLHELPEQIFSGTDTSFQTDCRDCGGYYLEIKKGGVVKTVEFSDAYNDAWPVYARKTYRLLSAVVLDLRK